MYEIIWAKQAEIRYLETLEFWTLHNHSNRYSLKIISEIDKIEALLLKNPYLGRVANDENIRVISILKKFLLYYKIQGNIIYIVSFISGDTNERL